MPAAQDELGAPDRAGRADLRMVDVLATENDDPEMHFTVLVVEERLVLGLVEHP